MKSTSDQKKFPFALLKEVLRPIEKSRQYWEYVDKGCERHEQYRVASRILQDLLKLSNEENPNWYSLYESMVKTYLYQKHEMTRMGNQIFDLTNQLKEIERKYLILAGVLNPNP